MHRWRRTSYESKFLFFLFAVIFTSIWLVNKINNNDKTSISSYHMVLGEMKYIRCIVEKSKEGSQQTEYYQFIINYKYNGEVFELKESTKDKYKNSKFKAIFKSYLNAKDKGERFIIPIYVNKKNGQDIEIYDPSSDCKWSHAIPHIVTIPLLYVFLFYYLYKIINKYKKNRNCTSRLKRYKNS